MFICSSKFTVNRQWLAGFKEGQAEHITFVQVSNPNKFDINRSADYKVALCFVSMTLDTVHLPKALRFCPRLPFASDSFGYY